MIVSALAVPYTHGLFQYGALILVAILVALLNRSIARRRGKKASFP
jgi:hypothetical protein